jgi:hypothetical protein
VTVDAVSVTLNPTTTLPEYSVANNQFPLQEVRTTAVATLALTLVRTTEAQEVQQVVAKLPVLSS